MSWFVFLCILGMLWGCLMMFAGGMSDAIREGEESARTGFGIFLISMIMLIAALVSKYFEV